MNLSEFKILKKQTILVPLSILSTIKLQKEKDSNNQFIKVLIWVFINPLLLKNLVKLKNQKKKKSKIYILQKYRVEVIEK